MKNLIVAGAVLSVAFLGCGGKSSSSPPSPSPTPVYVDGIWSGTITSTNPVQSLTGKALILPTGEFSFMSDDNTVMVNGTAATTSTAFSLDGASILNFVKNGGQIASTTVDFYYANIPIAPGGNSFSGNFTTSSDTFITSNWPAGSLALTYAEPFNVVTPLASIAGGYSTSTAPLGQQLTLTVNADGTFKDSTGTITGKLTPSPVANLNAFTVTVNQTPPNSTSSGVAFYIPAGASSASQAATLWIQAGLINAQMTRLPQLGAAQLSANLENPMKGEGHSN